MEIVERLAKMEYQIDTALAGVANFKQFQTEARDFFSRHDEREIQREKSDRKRTRRLNFIIGIGTLIFIAISAVAAILAAHTREAQSVLRQLSNSQYQYTLAERDK